MNNIKEHNIKIVEEDINKLSLMVELIKNTDFKDYELKERLLKINREEIKVKKELLEQIKRED